MADEDVSDDPALEEEDAGIAAPASRSEDICKKPGVEKALLEAFAEVERGFSDQNERINDILDYWDIYNCKLNGNQFYSGNSQIYVPIVHNALNARATRFVNQVFPQSGRNVEVTTSDGTLPQAIMSLLESYIRKSKLRTEVLPALVRNGDIEGQYNTYVDWTDIKRHVTTRVKKPVEVDEVILAPDETVDDMEEIVVEDAHPTVEVLSDVDVLVLPATADSVEKALRAGGSATIIRRWGKAKIRQMIRDKLIDKDAGQDLIAEMARKVEAGQRNVKHDLLEQAGIQTAEDDTCFAQIYETWLELKIDGERRRCVSFYAGKEMILGCRLNPLWCDRIPLLSVPVKKVAGVFKGVSQVKACATLQYAANDAINEGMDSAAYALLPIIMTDPEKNPRVGSMVLATAAIWETSPQDTQFAQFPQLWKEAFQIVVAVRAQIGETLGVSPAAITQQTSEKHLTQAEVANEQQVDILSTADAVTVLEEGQLTPFLTLFAELDHQHRDQKISVRSYGEMGVQAVMQDIEPLQMDTRYQFRWFGVESAKNAQQIQQQIAGLNVIQNIPPQLYQGYTLDLAPAIVQLVENTFGPRLAPLIFKDMRSQLSMPPQQENALLAEGIDMMVHPLDNDAQHMQVHLQALQGGDVAGTVRTHILKHQQALQMKATVAAMQQGVQAMQGQGQPQGGAAQGPTQPRPGAQPRMIRGPQQPAGAIHRDNMQDPQAAPREQ